MPIKPGDVARQHLGRIRPRDASANGGNAAAATPPADTVAARDKHRAAIAAYNVEQQRHDDLVKGQERLRTERREVQAALDEARDKLDHLRAEARAPRL